MNIHVYKLCEEGPGVEEIEDEDISAANHWILPACNACDLLTFNIQTNL